MDSLEQKNTGPQPEPAEEDDEPEDKPEAKPAEPPKPPPIEVKPSSGRPAILMGPSTSISSTFGATPGSILKLKVDGGTLTLKIPEDALDAGYNIDFKVEDKGLKKGPVVGNIAMLKLRRGDKMSATQVTTRGPDYEVSVPLGGKDSVNLAVGAVATDDQGAETGKPTWTIFAPTRIEAGFGEAYFTLKTIGPVMYLHATTAAPTAAAATP
jgi:hypothetical protein